MNKRTRIFCTCLLLAVFALISATAGAISLKGGVKGVRLKSGDKSCFFGISPTVSQNALLNSMEWKNYTGIGEKKPAR